jgi:hypothetical protein
MYHYDPTQALEELHEDALLPHPVKLRDMILRNSDRRTRNYSTMISRSTCRALESCRK